MCRWEWSSVVVFRPVQDERPGPPSFTPASGEQLYGRTVPVIPFVRCKDELMGFLFDYTFSSKTLFSRKTLFGPMSHSIRRLLRGVPTEVSRVLPCSVLGEGLRSAARPRTVASWCLMSL